MWMTGSNEVKAMLAEMGVSVGDDEARRIAAALAAILADLRKLDQVENEEGEPTPRFTAEG